MGVKKKQKIFKGESEQQVKHNEEQHTKKCLRPLGLILSTSNNRHLSSVLPLTVTLICTCCL